MIVAGSYDSYLVTLSIVVASLASYTALDLGGRIRVSHGLTRTAWLATAAIAMGGGIWSMHFIAMLAFLMPMAVSFGVGLTFLSLIIAIGVTGAGFYIIGTRRATMLQLALAGLFMGTGIVGMHYTGMAAMACGRRAELRPAICRPFGVHRHRGFHHRAMAVVSQFGELAARAGGDHHGLCHLGHALYRHGGRQLHHACRQPRRSRCGTRRRRQPRANQSRRVGRSDHLPDPDAVADCILVR